MKTFFSSFETKYNEQGEARTTIRIEKNGHVFQREYDATSEAEEKEATKDLQRFLVELEEETPAVEVTKEESPAKEPVQKPDDTEEPEEKPIVISEEDLEKLLARAHNTLSDIPNMKKESDVARMADDGIAFTRAALAYMGRAPQDEQMEVLASCAIYGGHLVNIIDRLTWALDNTLGRLDMARHRLKSWGDDQYAAALDEGTL